MPQNNKSEGYQPLSDRGGRCQDSSRKDRWGAGVCTWRCMRTGGDNDTDNEVIHTVHSDQPR